MLSHYRHLVRNMRRLVISRSDTATGPRIGGKAPEGINPPKTHHCTRYFATVSLNEPATREVSLFTSLDYDDIMGRATSTEI